jgi:RNA-binding protein YhbY
MFKQIKVQIGKKGLTDEAIAKINELLKDFTNIRVAVLKSATRNQEELKKMSEELCSKLKIKCKARLIGYTIILKRQ